MKAAALPVTKLYDTHNKAYVIPSYQRPFAWSNEKAIDLLEAIWAEAQAGAKVTSLGTLLFCPVETSVKHPFGDSTATTLAPNTIWEVVDGQQRMTVFAMIGHALGCRHEELTRAGLLYAPSLEFEMFYSTSRTKKGKSVPVLIRDGDGYDAGYQSDLAMLLDHYAGNRASTASVGKRLLATQDAIRQWVIDNLNAVNFAQFCEHFMAKCMIVQVEADDQDTAFMMFEPLNSTSEPLTAFEVYRSKAVRKFNAQFDETSALLDYEQANRDEVIKRSNTLIFAMAQAYSGERPRVHFVPLKRYLDKHVAREFIDRFERGAEFFRTVWFDQTAGDPWFDEEARNCVRFLKAMSHDVAVPLLLRYFLTEPAALPAVLKIVVAFYGLWRAAFPTNNLPGIYRSLLTENDPMNMAIASASPLKSPLELATYFRTRLENKIGAPQPGQIIFDKWKLDQPFLDYHELKTLCRLYIFLDMGMSIKSNLVPNDPWTFVDDVEHIHAAGLEPTPPNVHRIGNLTFLPATVNKSLQNSPWPDKKEVYTLLSSAAKVAASHYSNGLPLPPAVQEFLKNPASPSLAHLGPLAAHPGWTESDIEARSQSVLANVWAVLYERWLRP